VAVFAGGFSLAAAEAVSGIARGELLDSLQTLLENGLLRLEAAGAEPRYRLLETVREYAAERLATSGQAAAVRGRYADYYVRADARRTRLGAEDDENLRGALEAILAETLDTSRQQGRLWEAALALDGLGGLAAARGDLEAAATHYAQSLELFARVGDTHAAALGRLHLGEVAVRLADDPAHTRRLLEDAIAQLRTGGPPGALARGQFALACLALQAGELAAGAEQLRQGLLLVGDAGDSVALAAGLEAAGRLASLQGAAQQATALLAAADRLRQAAGVPAPSFGPAGAVSADACIQAALDVALAALGR
jgi:hypothetical protein